jgi:hypothetical protein
MSNNLAPTASVSAFVMGVEITDRLPYLPQRAQEVNYLPRAEPYFLLQSLSNLQVKKCGRRSGTRTSFK